MKLLLSFAMVFNASILSAADYAPRVGELHPDFVLPQIDTGEPLQLSHFRGKRVLLVHFASW